MRNQVFVCFIPIASKSFGTVPGAVTTGRAAMYPSQPPGSLPLQVPYRLHQNPGILKYGDIPHEY